MGNVWLKWRNRSAAMVYDVFCIPMAWLGAYWLRYNLSEIPHDMLVTGLAMLPLVMFSQMLAFWHFGLYKGVWRFASIPDLKRIIKAISAGTLVTLLAIFLVFRLQDMPRSVIPLYGMLLLLLLGGARFLVRGFKDKKNPLNQAVQRVLIVGAGHAGEGLVRDLLRSTGHSYLPVAFVDDVPQKMGREIQGIRVVGMCNDIPKVVKGYAIDVILIAIPSANAASMRRVVTLCKSTQKCVRTLPGLNDLVTGRLSVSSLREISLEDLLGRDPVRLDWQAISDGLSEKTVLISGAGGSIGSELCRQVLRQHPKRLVVVDNSEYNVFKLEQAFSKMPLSCPIDYYLTDICDGPGIWKLIRSYQPNTIFHAAAFKHVPMLEDQLRAAIRNNVLGTHTLAQAAVVHGVEKFVLVSTDKAVNPSNVMGVSKRMAEMVCQHFNMQQKTRFITVRFGNVLGSRGSVLETFKAQLERGGPLTVTHPEVTRFFMTLQEACQLILQAFTMGHGGELFVLDMGEPIKIRYMAEQIIRLAGKPLEEIPIEYVGLRPGEKLYEELFHKREHLQTTTHNKILKAQPREVDSTRFEMWIQRLQHAVAEFNHTELQTIVREMVPELDSKLEEIPLPIDPSLNLPSKKELNTKEKEFI